MYERRLPCEAAQNVAAFHMHPIRSKHSHEISVQRARRLNFVSASRNTRRTWEELSDAWDELQNTATTRSAPPDEIAGDENTLRRSSSAGWLSITTGGNMMLP
jgi:ferric-dicitrate binding protein FerR (iron transport regulator)